MRLRSVAGLTITASAEPMLDDPDWRGLIADQPT
jgi:hypothetical protein